MTESAGMADVLGFLVWITVIPVLVALAMRSRSGHGDDQGNATGEGGTPTGPKDGDAGR